MISSSDICLFLFPQTNVLKVGDVESVKKNFFALCLFINLFFEKFRCRFQVLRQFQVLSCAKQCWLIANQAKYLWVKVYGTHGLLWPVLQVGVNPPGTKRSSSLPSRRDPSTALVTPRCRGSRALGARTRSALCSRTTCSPTVCTGGKRVPAALLGAGLAFLPSLSQGEVMGDTWWQQGQSFPCLLHLGLMSRPLSASPSDCSLLEKSLFNGFGTASL